MPTDHRKRLARIRRFDQLIAYLRDELGWPIDADDFEELTFEYTPEELGIDAKNAAKIQEIKRLRPLVPGQPWGIFFIKFEPKRLPVVALRRILGQVALKKRASANKSERQAWAADDLLFVSNYGEGEERRIAFAHFSKPQDGHDLPTLKVLGWDNLDTPLHLDAVARELSDHLAWPDDEEDTDAWRERWRDAFKLRHREVITTSKELSERLAELARAIRDRIRTALAIETETGPLTKLMKAFQTALVHALDKAGFADMYAQTIAYGLLSARITDPARRTADDFAAHMRTNPFLREMMETFLRVGGRRGKAGGSGIDFDELGVSEVVELLDRANMEEVVRDFGDRNPPGRPSHSLLRALPRRLRQEAEGEPRRLLHPAPRGLLHRALGGRAAAHRVWARGWPRRHHDLERDGEAPRRSENPGRHLARSGLCSRSSTRPPEPALSSSRSSTSSTTRWSRSGRAQGHGEKKIQALWNEYVPRHLLPRLHGYELLMAPYAIAHLKIGLKLYETGYHFESDERARVYLTNALEPADSTQLTLDFLPALAHEAQAVNEIKRKQRFTVVIGNPPYSGLSSNMGPWIDGLLKGRLPDGTATASYYHVNGEPLGERKVWLQDDYVKFIRLSQWLLDGTGAGIHGYISNHGYLDNPTFRGMRWSLMQSFRRIRVLDLHGNLKKKEAPPGGGRDVNVFDIQQGVAIGLFTKAAAARSVCHADLWGERENKYRWLLEHVSLATEWAQLEPAPRFYLFEPFDESGADSYSDWPAINKVMPVNVTGIVTARDGFVIDLEPSVLLDRIETFLDNRLSDTEVKERLGLKENYAWRVAAARRELRTTTKRKRLEDFVTKILYRPFDERFIFWHPSVVWRPRTKAMPHMLAGENLSIGLTRTVEVGSGFSHVFASREMIQHHTVSLKEVNYQFPLYLYPGVGKADASLFSRWAEGKDGRAPNLDSGFVEHIAAATELRFVSDGCGDLRETFGPENILAWIYGVLHSPRYRERYEAHLKLDFPRVPLPGSVDLLRKLAEAGHDLMALHLLESPKLGKPITSYTGPRNPEVGRVGWSDGTVWLDAGKTNAREGHRATMPGTMGFQGVPVAIWDFYIGGYQVCHKWLKDRKGHTLSDEDVAHYQKIVVALNETIRIMAEIHEVIEAHGGWPDAFSRAYTLRPV